MVTPAMLPSGSLPVSGIDTAVSSVTLATDPPVAVGAVFGPTITVSVAEPTPDPAPAPPISLRTPLRAVLNWKASGSTVSTIRRNSTKLWPSSLPPPMAPAAGSSSRSSRFPPVASALAIFWKLFGSLASALSLASGLSNAPTSASIRAVSPGCTVISRPSASFSVTTPASFATTLSPSRITSPTLRRRSLPEASRANASPEREVTLAMTWAWAMLLLQTQ